MNVLGYEILLRKKPEAIIGINSNLDVDPEAEWWEHHVLMIDYDDKLDEPSLRRETARLQQTYGLGRALLWKSSSDHWFVVFPRNVLTYWECLQIIHDTSCDNDFKCVRMVYRYITLRVSPKSGAVPQLVHIMENPTCDTKRYVTHCTRFEKSFVRATQAWSA